MSEPIKHVACMCAPCVIGRIYEITGISRLAADEANKLNAIYKKRAKDWARDATEEYGQRHTFCRSCNVEILGPNVIRLHAHDCDAAIILGLDREVER